MSIVMNGFHKFTHKKFDKVIIKFNSTLNLANVMIASLCAFYNAAFCEFNFCAFCEK